MGRTMLEIGRKKAKHAPLHTAKKSSAHLQCRIMLQRLACMWHGQWTSSATLISEAAGSSFNAQGEQAERCGGDVMVEGLRFFMLTDANGQYA